MDPHFDSLVATSANHLVRHKVDAVHLVGMTGQIDPDLVCLQVPQLTTRRIQFQLGGQDPCGAARSWLTLRVVSLLALTSMRESADHASR